nr:reverse transcriptase domain-containing protein [Tanacetum cinerariifolium]
MASNENGDDVPPAGGGDLQVPDLRTMEESCQPTLNGRVQNSCQFHGLSGDDANKHLDKFLHVTQTIKVNGVTDDALRLYLFPHSLTHHATAWFDCLLRNYINTFEQMAKMFLGKYFPPSMVMKLRNEITNFRQRPDESLFEAWERYKLSIDRCPNHNMLPVTQIDTFYNGLTLRHRDTINAAAGGTFMKRPTVGQTQNIYAAGAYNQGGNSYQPQGNRNLMNTASSSGLGTLPSNTITNPKEDLKGITTRSGNAYQGPTIPTTSSSPKVVEHETEVTKDTVPPTNNGITKDIQSPPNPKPSIPYPSRLHDQKLRDKSNDQKKKFFQIFQDLNFNISFMDDHILMPKFGSTIKSLLTKKDKLFELARTPLNEHYSTVLLKKLPKRMGDLGKFLIPCDFSGMDECLALADLGASINLMPLSVWNKLSLLELSPTCMRLEFADRSISRPVGVSEDVFVKVRTFHFPADFVVVDFDADPRVSLILGRSFLKIGHALIDVYKGELTLRIGKEAITFNLDQTSRYSANYDAMSVNRIDLIDVACEEYSQEVLRFSGDILLLEEFLNDDPSSQPLPPQELKVVEPTNEKSSNDEPPMVELKDLPPHLKYAFLEGDDKFPVIIAKDLKDEEKTTLIKVLKSHKQALAWKLSDINDLPEADMKEILRQRMWETESYKSHEDHMLLYKALEKSINHDHSQELTQDLAEARKKKKKSRESPKTPPGSPPHQPPPSPPLAGPSRASGAPGAFGSSQVPPPSPPPSSTNQENLEMDEDMGPDEQAQSLDDEDIGSAHIPKASALASNYSPPPKDSLLAQTGDIATFIDWFRKRRGITELKPQDLEGPAFEIIKVFHLDVIHLQYQMEECHKLLTDSVDDPIIRHNVSKPLPLGGPPGQVTIQSDFFFNKDLEYLRYGSKGRRPALSISKMKGAYYPDAGLEQMVPNQFWIEEECKYDIAAMYGISHWWFQRQRFYINRHTSEGDCSTVRTHMRILSVVKIEVFSMYGYDYMKKTVLRRADLNEHVIAERDFKYLYPSDFEDLYLLNLQGHLNHLPPKDKKILTTAVNQWTRHLVIRQRVEDFQLGIESYQTQLNLTKPQWDATGFEYKHDYTVIDSPRAVIDGTLPQIDEALDYRVKEFRINKMNLVDIEKVTVCSSIRSPKPKHTIESRAKRSSKIISLGHYSIILTSSHTVKNGNPARANIKKALANELTNAFGKPFEVLNNIFEHWVFNSLVYLIRALSALRRSGLRTASTAAKPCQEDSSEFYLIIGNIYTDQRGTMVLATLFNESE